MITELFDKDLEIAVRLSQWNLADVAKSWVRTAASVCGHIVQIEIVGGFLAELVGRATLRVPEITRMAATTDTWQEEVLAFLDTRASNTSTPGLNRM